MHGRGKNNDNGQRLLELCCFPGLCVMNTFSKCKDILQMSWRHPHSRHWRQLALVITRRAELSSVLLTRTYSADCDTDHSLVTCKVRITPKKIHHGKKKGRPRINTCCVSNQERTKHYISQLEETLADTTDQSRDLEWAHIRNAMHTSVITAYGKKKHKNADWYEAHWEETEPVIEEKRKALLAYKSAPGPSTLAALRAARKKSQQTARHWANTNWLNLCNSIPQAADFGDARGMYLGIKKATGPAPSKSAPLKSKSGNTITDQGKQLEHWVEHYFELYATQNVVTETALDAIPILPVMDELDSSPTTEELDKAIDNLACGKAPGSDGIPAEVLNSGKPALLKHLSLCSTALPMLGRRPHPSGHARCQHTHLV